MKLFKPLTLPKKFEFYVGWWQLQKTMISKPGMLKLHGGEGVTYFYLWAQSQVSLNGIKNVALDSVWWNHKNIRLNLDSSLPAIALNVSEGREFLWSKTKQAFRYVYEHYKTEADWFVKADDDTFMIVENLRYMLQAYNTTKPIYFGCKFKPYVRQGYMSGGAGYVLSSGLGLVTLLWLHANHNMLYYPRGSKEICDARHFRSNRSHLSVWWRWGWRRGNGKMYGKYWGRGRWLEVMSYHTILVYLLINKQDCCFLEFVEILWDVVDFFHLFQNTISFLVKCQMIFGIGSTFIIRLKRWKLIRGIVMK